MTVAIKNNNKEPLILSSNLRRKAGFKTGQELEVKVSEGIITIARKLTPDEIEDERELADPKIRAAIRKGHEEFLAGKTRPIQEFFAERDRVERKRPRKTGLVK
jgi:hypothetical protein